MQKVSNPIKRFSVVLLATVFTLSTAFVSPQAVQAFSVSYTQSPGFTSTAGFSSTTYFSTYSSAKPVSTTPNTYSPVKSSPAPAKKPLPPAKKPLEQKNSKQGVEIKTLASGTKYATDLYIINSGRPGPVVMIIGGVHGSEKAGYRAASQVKDWSIKKGTLLVIPEANKPAIEINRRTAKGGSDLNRQFPKTKNGSPKTTLSKAIYQVVKDYDVEWLMDMHEGYDYCKSKANKSVGQTLIYYPANNTRSTVKDIVAGLNQDISSSYREFTLLRYPVKGSLARAAGEFQDVHSFIFETCEKQKLTTRINNQLKAADLLLSKLDMR